MIVVPGDPQAKERPRKGAHGNFYTPRGTVAYEDSVAWAVKASGVRFDGEDVSVTLTFYCAGRKRPDLDNLVKAALDGAQKGGLFTDDRQVASIVANRIDESDEPRTVIIASRLFHYPQ